MKPGIIWVTRNAPITAPLDMNSNRASTYAASSEITVASAAATVETIRLLTRKTAKFDCSNRPW